MDKIKILLIDVRADLGGGSAHLDTLLQNLNREKFELFAAFPNEQPFAERFRQSCSKTLSVPYRSFSLLAFYKLLRFIEKNKIHLIHSHGRGAGIYSRLAGYFLNLPVIHTFHGISYGKGSIRELAAIQLEKWFAHHTTRFIHVSASEQDCARSIGASHDNRSTVIRNGIDWDSFQSDQETRSKTRVKLQFQPDDFVIGCVARFDPCKRHQDLIEAMTKLVLKKSNVRLVLIGKGETEKKMKQIVAEKALGSHVFFLGEQKDIKPFYQAFDLFVLPSLHEGLPLAPLEALASACPVIVTDVRGNRDLVEHEKTGLLVREKDPTTLCQAIERLMSNETLRKQLSQNGNQELRERFSIAQMINSVEALYSNLCQIPRLRRVALVHDWLFHMRGGEKVLEAIGEIFPSAPIYTLFAKRSKISDSLKSHPLYVSWLNSIPGVQHFYRFLLPIFPFVFRSLKLKRYDLVISNNHCFAKGVRKPKKAVHICYCHTPMRYAWGFEAEYFGNYPLVLRTIARWFVQWLRRRDLKTNRGVDYFVANSTNVQNRIHKFYERDSTVIYPPIRTMSELTTSPEKTEDYFLIVSALVPYKRIEIAIDAFNKLALPLIVIGTGPLLRFLKKKAKSHIQFLGWLGDNEITRYYRGCRALIFPTEEDFGMVPLEAMSYGKPVIAYGKGGALETVIPANGKERNVQPTGLFFYEQTSESLCKVIKEFERFQFDSHAIQKHVEKFSTIHFKSKFSSYVGNVTIHDNTKRN